MRNFQTEFSLVTPKLLEEEENVSAWFTLKNRSYGKGEYAIPGLNLGFNTSEKREVIAKNRLDLLSSLQLDSERVAYADQVHSNRVRFVTEGGTYPSTDGLVTRVPGLTLGIQVADCAAVLLWDTSNMVVGALHAGWRGAAGDIVSKGLQKMVEHGGNPQKMKAFISPCISVENFEVGREVAEQFPDAFVDYEHYQKPHVNLKAFIRHQLEEGGVPNSKVEISRECTIDGEEDYYSYRREGEESGRMLALIQITD